MRHDCRHTLANTFIISWGANKSEQQTLRAGAHAGECTTTIAWCITFPCHYADFAQKHTHLARTYAGVFAELFKVYASALQYSHVKDALSCKLRVRLYGIIYECTMCAMYMSCRNTFCSAGCHRAWRRRAHTHTHTHPSGWHGCIDDAAGPSLACKLDTVLCVCVVVALELLLLLFLLWRLLAQGPGHSPVYPVMRTHLIAISLSFEFVLNVVIGLNTLVMSHTRQHLSAR